MKPEQIQPLDDMVLVEPIAASEITTPEGLILMESSEGGPQKGTVIVIGNPIHDKTRKPLDELIGVGDVIIYSRYAGLEVRLNQKDFYLINRKDIKAVVLPENDAEKAERTLRLKHKKGD